MLSSEILEYYADEEGLLLTCTCTHPWTELLTPN